jgi:hypothetical protein
MEKLINILKRDLGIETGALDMETITVDRFIKTVWNGLYGQYIECTITGTIQNQIASIQYDGDTFCCTRMSHNDYNINIMRPHNNSLTIRLKDVKIVQLSISNNNWIDIHLLTEADDYSQYVSIVLRAS